MCPLGDHLIKIQRRGARHRFAFSERPAIRRTLVDFDELVTKQTEAPQLCNRIRANAIFVLRLQTHFNADALFHILREIERLDRSDGDTIKHYG